MGSQDWSFNGDLLRVCWTEAKLVGNDWSICSCNGGVLGRIGWVVGLLVGLLGSIVDGSFLQHP